MAQQAKEVIFDPSEIKPLATHNEPPTGEKSRVGVFTSPLAPEFQQVREGLEKATAPNQPDRPVMRRSRTGALYPSAENTEGATGIAKAVARGAGGELLNQAEGSTTPAALATMGVGGALGTRAGRAITGPAVEGVGRGVEAVGNNIKSPLISMFGVTQLANHPILGTTMIAGAPVLRGAGRGLQKLGAAITPGAASGPRLATLGLSQEEAAVQRALQMLKEQRAASTAAEAQQGLHDMPMGGTPAPKPMSGPKPPVDYTKYSRQSGAGIEDFVPPAGTINPETGQRIPPTVEEHLAALKAYQARKYPGRAVAPKAVEPPIYGSPESIAAIDAKQAAAAAAGPSVAPTGESLGDLGRAISTDAPSPGGAPNPVSTPYDEANAAFRASAPPTSANTTARLADEERRLARGASPTGTERRSATEPPAAKSARAPESKIHEDTAAAPKARAAVEGQTGEKTPIEGSQEDAAARRARLTSDGVLPLKHEGEYRGYVNDPLQHVVDTAVASRSMIPRQAYTAAEIAALRDLKAGGDAAAAVDPAVAKSALQKLREAMGREGMRKAGYRPGQIAQTTGGEIPHVKMKQIADAIGNITTREQAAEYMKHAPPNIRLSVQTLLERKGLL